jgi:hypothetical protein
MAKQIIAKKVKLKLVGLDGNAFVLMGAFAAQARREKWTQEEIDAVMGACESGDYRNLVATLMEHCENGGLGGDDEDDEYEDD